MNIQGDVLQLRPMEILFEQWGKSLSLSPPPLSIPAPVPLAPLPAPPRRFTLILFTVHSITTTIRSSYSKDICMGMPSNRYDSKSTKIETKMLILMQELLCGKTI